MISYSQFYLKEANVGDIEPLMTAIKQLLDGKKVKNEPVRKWFNTQFIKWFKSSEDDDKKPIKKHVYVQGEKEYMSKDDVVDFTGFSTEYKGYLEHMIDYLDKGLSANELNVLYKQPYPIVVKALADNDQAALKKVEEMEDNPPHNLKENTDYEVIVNTEDISGRPMAWVKLLTKDSYQCESNAMGHCVKDYDPATPNQDIISLWNEQLSPKVTLEILNGKEIKQIKGKANLAPANRYQKTTIDYIQKLLKEGYKVTGDGENIGMNEYEGKYYFSEDPKWVKIYNDKIVPMQQRVFEEIKRRIVTVAGEGYSLVESYLTNLQKGFRYV